MDIETPDIEVGGLRQDDFITVIVSGDTGRTRILDGYYVLITTGFNYADEFDVYGWCIRKVVENEQCEQALQEYFDRGGDTLEISFGTNESIEISSYKEYLRGINKRILTTEHFNVLMRVFEEIPFGKALDAREWVYAIIEEDE